MIIKLRGTVKNYLWGGNVLIEKYNQISNNNTLAESWIVSSHPNGPSYIVDPEIVEKTLNEYIINHPDSLGTKCLTKNSLPIIIKLINSNEPLSIQVHPDDKYANKYENQTGKNEMWYVLEADKNAEIIIGTNEKMTLEDFRDAVLNKRIEKCLKHIKVKKNDAFYIPAGTIHAIGAGLVVCEIQQNSDLTYRIFDYDRKDKNGKYRDIHIDKALDVVNLEPIDAKVNIKSVINNKRNFVKSTFMTKSIFKVNTYNIKEDCILKQKTSSFLCLVVLDGTVSVEYMGDNAIGIKGESFFIPAGNKNVCLRGESVILTVSL